MQRSSTQELVAAAERDARACSVLMSSDPDYLGGQASFHAQQRAEKYAKAVALEVLGGYGRTHQIDDLLEAVAKERGIEVPEEVLDHAAQLSAYVTMARYPAGFEISAEDAREAIAYSDEVVGFLVNMGFGEILGMESEQLGSLARLDAIFASVDKKLTAYNGSEPTIGDIIADSH